MFTDQGSARKFVAQMKWDKAKSFLAWVESALEQGTELEQARFLSGTGFLVHMSMTYNFMQPYLKGFHLSMDAWQPNRSEKGWRIRVAASSSETDEGYTSDEDFGEATDEMDNMSKLAPCGIGLDFGPEAPPSVSPVPLLHSNVRTLQRFFGPNSLLPV